MPRRRAEPKPPPILKFQTSTEYEHAERIRELLDQARLIAATGSVGAVARKRQYLNALINPHATSFVYEDHGGQRRATVTLSSNMARDRLDSVRALRTDGRTREEVGDLLGVTKSAVQALEERAEGKRAKQKRISLKDAERLEAAKVADAAVQSLTPVA
jgi:hypothetical protein